MVKAKNLKAALHSQQSRLKAKDKLSKIAEQKNAKHNSRSNLPSKGKAKAVPLQPPRRQTFPFRPTDKILLVGEGDFSFAHALIYDSPSELRSFPSSNLTATAYDSEQECYEKYADARDIVSRLRDKDVEVLFGVDATRLEKTPSLKGRSWDRVVWNFPHAGKGITDQNRNILSNQMLILGFLRSASKILSLGVVPSSAVSRKKRKKNEDDGDDDDNGDDPDSKQVTAKVLQDNMGDENEFIAPQDVAKTRGTVLITLRNVPPYTLWDVPRLAKKPPPPTSGSAPPNPRYILLRSFRFDRSAYAGYEHRMTKGARAHGTGKTGEGGEDRTWEFCVQDCAES